MAPAQDNSMDWVMWPSCIMHLPLSEQLDATDPPLQTRSLASQVMLRKFPGDGSLDISRMLSIVDAKGGLASVGPEVVGAALEGLSLSEIGIRSGESVRNALARVRKWSATGP